MLLFQASCLLGDGFRQNRVQPDGVVRFGDKPLSPDPARIPFVVACLTKGPPQSAEATRRKASTPSITVMDVESQNLLGYGNTTRRKRHFRLRQVAFSFAR